MDEIGMARVTELMGQMERGEGAAAAFALQAEFAGPLRGAVRRAASRRGVELHPAEVDDLVADVVLMLHDHASGWRPDSGALPWVWADRRVGNIVDRHIGQFTDELDDARLAQLEVVVAAAGPASEPPSLAVLDRLAAIDRRVDTLQAALREVATPRDVELWLEMRVEESLGDRSPAATVAPQLGISAESARQQRRRIDQRLRRLLASDDRYASLAEVAGLADAASVA